MNTETIYVDNLKHCHRINDGTMGEIHTEFFVGKCDLYVEGFCCETSKEYILFYPWKPYNELEAAQAQYEQMLPELEDMRQALKTLGVTADG